MSAGPFFGGLLTKIGTSNEIFNGYTSPAWIMAVVWIVFWVCVYMWFEDVGEHSRRRPQLAIQSVSLPIEKSLETVPGDTSSDMFGSEATLVDAFHRRTVSAAQWGVIVCMCWFAMTCFFILGTF